MRLGSEILAVAALTLAFGASAVAQTGDGRDLLGSERWRERRFGVSFLPPIDAERGAAAAAEDELVTFDGSSPEYRLTLDVKRAEQPVELASITESAKRQQSTTHPDAKLLGVRRREVGGWPARQLSFRIPVPARRTDALLEQVLIQPDAMTIAVVEMRGRFGDADRLRALLDAVLGSLEIADQEELAQRRREAVERTEKWRKTLTPEAMKAAAGGTDYYRLIDGRRDVGWMEVERATGSFNGTEGITVLVTTHLRLAQGRIDARGRYFRPLEGVVGETWELRRTYRFADRRRPPRTTAETGTVTNEHVEVRIDANTGEKNQTLKFNRPPAGYMPQADAFLLGGLLPHRAATAYGFYYYNRGEGKITFRRDKLTPALDGFVIATRLSPDSPERRAEYDRRGRLQSRDLGGGRKLIRTDAATLRRLWQTRR